MKPLQSNYTTPKQSKRLLKLGLPADSADLGIIDDVMNKDIEVLHIPYSQWCKGYENISVPCWSVGRLIEIYYICSASRERIGYSGPLPFVERIVSRFEQWNDAHLIDFSKLED